MSDILYVVGTEASGKTDLLNQLGLFFQKEVQSGPAAFAPTTGQGIEHLEIDSETSVEVRELGGSMINSWEKFILSKMKSNKEGASLRFHLMFVVDATAPHRLPQAITSFMYLKEKSKGICHSWRTLVVVQKCFAPRALSVQEVEMLLLTPEYANTTQVIEVDSWNAVGLGDVAEWIVGLQQR